MTHIDKILVTNIGNCTRSSIHYWWGCQTWQLFKTFLLRFGTTTSG